MSEADIRTISEQTVAEIIGGNASPRFKQAVEKAIRPLLQGHLEVCRRSFRASYYALKVATVLNVVGSQ